LIRRAGLVAIGAVIGGGFYLLLIDTNSLPELYVLAAVALTCAAAFVVSREQGFVEARIKASWVLKIWRPVAKVPLDIVLVSAEALAQLVRRRAVRGQFRAVRFDAMGDTPEDTARRALTDVLGSLAPNTIVIGVDQERGLLLVHQLRRQGEPRNLDVLRLG